MLLKIFRIVLFLLLSLTALTVLFMQQRSFGRLPSGARLERVKNSQHYKGGTFQNLQKTTLLAPGVSYVSMFTKYFTKGMDREPEYDLPTVKTDLTRLSDNPTVIWFGHSSFLISVDGKKILADPVFSQRPSPVQYAGAKSYPGTMVYSADDLPPLDIVIISHDHYDHLDYNTITKLNSKTKLFCVPLGVSEHLLHWGVDALKIREFDWWESDTVSSGVELIATPARHFSGRGFRGNRTLWASYVLKTGGLTIFIGGDSGYDSSFKTIGEKYGPFDIAMLECGQYDVQWPDIHMMPEETVQASVDLDAKVLLPVHWGKFTLALHPWRDPIQRAVMHAAKLNVNITTPRIGEPIILGQGWPGSHWWDGK